MTAAAVRTRRVPRRRSGRALKAGLGVCLLAALLGGGWIWFRDSPLVAVERITIVGDNGPDSPQIRDALLAAARTMTTLDVHRQQLEIAVAPFPVIKSLSVSTQFPHGMRIVLAEEVPVAAIEAGGRAFPVARDGTLLRDTPAAGLPVITLTVAPGGTRIADGMVREEIALVASAPRAMLARMGRLMVDPLHGLSAQVKGGPVIYFGPPAQLEDKWTAAVAVLAQPGSVGAPYVDVTDPGRPVAGAGGDVAGAPVSPQSGTTSAGG